MRTALHEINWIDAAEAARTLRAALPAREEG